MDRLARRIVELERRVPPPVKPIQPIDLKALLKVLRDISGYEPWENRELRLNREAQLTLEERLALARRDAIPKPSEWKNLWDPQLGCLRMQEVIDPKPERAAEAARELEIQILERDGKIDSDTAETLRANADAHFRARLQRAPSPVENVDLMTLPFPILIEDQEAVAEEALRKCPLRKSLPLEEQLEIAKTELAATRGSSRYEPGGLFEKVDEGKVRELEIKILERDGKLDQHAAQKLRENIEAHTRFNAQLDPLPAAVNAVPINEGNIN